MPAAQDAHEVLGIAALLSWNRLGSRRRHDRRPPWRLDAMRAFGISAGTTIAVTAVSGLFGIISTRTLGPSQRGLLAAAVIWTSVLSSILVVGLPQAVTYHAGRAGSNAGRFVGTGLVL